MKRKILGLALTPPGIVLGSLAAFAIYALATSSMPPERSECRQDHTDNSRKSYCTRRFNLDERRRRDYDSRRTHLSAF